MTTALTEPLLPAQENLQRIVHEMARKIFHNITPRSRKANISSEDVDYALNLMTDAISSNKAFNYLTAQDSMYMRKLVLAIEAGMRDVFSDNLITLSDVPAILKMCKEICLSVNSMHAKGTAGVQIAVHTLLPMIEIIVCLVAQMMIPAPEYLAARNIIAMCFDLLSTNVTPLLAMPCPWWSKMNCLHPTC